jgi:hypothetical protein
LLWTHKSPVCSANAAADYAGVVEYKHTQTGYLGVLVLTWLVFVGGLVIALAGDEEPAALWIMAAAFVVVGVAVLWFSRLTVAVDGGQVKVYFGPGRPHRIIETRDIIGFRRLRNKWSLGWGMRKVPGGWMFNVWGLDAVELELANGKKFRIGTDEPAELVAALRAYTALRPG